MASAKFLEEALSTDVDESAVSAIVGSLENQLVTSTPTASGQTNLVAGINQNHLNSAISNGGTVPSQKHGTIANGESIVVTTAEANKLLANNALPGTIITGAAAQAATGAVQNQAAVANYINQAAVSSVAQTKTNEGVKVVYSQTSQAMTSTGAVLTNRVTFPSQSVPNGTIGLSPINQQQTTPQTILQTSTTNVQTIPAKQPTLVIKTSGAPPGAPGLVTVPMNVTASVPQVNNVGSPSSQSTTTVLSNLQVVNVRSGVATQPQKGQTARVVLSAPQMVGARPGAPVSCCTLYRMGGFDKFYFTNHR